MLTQSKREQKIELTRKECVRWWCEHIKGLREYAEDGQIKGMTTSELDRLKELIEKDTITNGEYAQQVKLRRKATIYTRRINEWLDKLDAEIAATKERTADLTTIAKLQSDNAELKLQIADEKSVVSYQRVQITERDEEIAELKRQIAWAQEHDQDGDRNPDDDWDRDDDDQDQDPGDGRDE